MKNSQMDREKRKLSATWILLNSFVPFKIMILIHLSYFEHMCDDVW